MYLISMSSIADGAFGYLRDIRIVNTALTPDVKPSRMSTANISASRQEALSYSDMEAAQKVKNDIENLLADTFYNVKIVKCGYGLFDKKTNTYLKEVQLIEGRRITHMSKWGVDAYVFRDKVEAELLTKFLGNDFDFILHVMEIH